MSKTKSNENDLREFTRVFKYYSSKYEILIVLGDFYIELLSKQLSGFFPLFYLRYLVNIF